MHIIRLNTHVYENSNKNYENSGRDLELFTIYNYLIFHVLLVQDIWLTCQTNTQENKLGGEVFCFGSEIRGEAAKLARRLNWRTLFFRK